MIILTGSGIDKDKNISYFNFYVYRWW